MPAHRFARVLEHHRFRIINDDAIGHAAEMLEGALMAAEPFTQPLSGKGDREAAPRNAERHDEDLGRDLDVVDPHPGLPEVDLRFLVMESSPSRGLWEAPRYAERAGVEKLRRTQENAQHTCLSRVATTLVNQQLSQPGRRYLARPAVGRHRLETLAARLKV